MTDRETSALMGRRVLVVEDQYLIAEETRRMVVELGAEVVGPVSRPDAAITVIQTSPPDFAVLDINLGDQHAYEVAAELLRRQVPFAFATGCEPWVIPEAFRDVPRLDKPLTAKMLAEVAHQLGL